MRSKNKSTKSISISFDLKLDGNVVLEYFDSGEWKETSENGFGIELLELLTDQLDGKINRNDSTFKIEFPLLDNV